MNIKLLKFLRRVGVLRFGAESAVYHNAGERPLSFQQDNVFNSKKDAVELKTCCSGKRPPVKSPSQDEATK